MRRKRKSRKGKSHDFVSKGQDEKVNLMGTKYEYTALSRKQWMLFLIIIAGFILLIMDIRDEGMMFSTPLFKFSGSLIGGFIMIGGILWLFYSKAKVNIQ